MKERESEWRKLRVEQYKELVTSMSEVVAEQSDASRARLALAANHIGLFASPAVLRQLTRLLEAVAQGQMEQHDAILTELMHAIHEALKVPVLALLQTMVRRKETRGNEIPEVLATSNSW